MPVFDFSTSGHLFSKGRVDCRRLRRRQCDRTSPLSLRTFCAAPLLSCQRLGTSRTQERMDAAIWPSARKYPPNAGPDVRPRVFSCYGVPLRAWDGYPLLRGRLVHRPPGQTCFQDKAQVGTPWTHQHEPNVTIQRFVLITEVVAIGYSTTTRIKGFHPWYTLK